MLGGGVPVQRAKPPAIEALAAALQPVVPPGPPSAADLNEWNDQGIVNPQDVDAHRPHVWPIW